MKNPLHPLAAAAALLVTLAPAAFAGGAHVKVSGPGKDGRTYMVHAYLCSNPAALKVTAWAEGLVDGRRQTVPVKVRRTSTKGVYELTRTWPEGGQWALRMAIGGSHTPVTVVALEPDGAVRANQLIWEGDGRRECAAILAGEDDC
jgi:hypothetical protein